MSGVQVSTEHSAKMLFVVAIKVPPLCRMNRTEMGVLCKKVSEILSLIKL